jgi:cytochrome c biogenesis protein CcdA
VTEVSLLTAFAAGTLALLSPCSALLLPSFFAYAFAGRTALLWRTVLFYLGLLITLVPLGTGASAVSQVFYGHRSVLIAVAGWTIIVLGVVQIATGGIGMPFAARLQSWASGRGQGLMSTVVLGAVYGLAGFCSGPILGAILTMAATSGRPLTGAALLAAYGLGMAAPLFLLAAMWDRLGVGGRSWLRGREITVGPLRVHTTSLVAGLLFIAIGVLFLAYDGTAGMLTTLGLGDTTGFELSAQEWITRWLGGVPGWTVPAAVAVIALVVAWRRSRNDPDGRTDA